MASRRKEHKEDAKFRVFQIINENPQMSTREIAQKVGISNGSAYYLLTSLIEMGFIKLSNFKDSSQKVKYSYYITWPYNTYSFIFITYIVSYQYKYMLTLFHFIRTFIFEYNGNI